MEMGIVDLVKVLLRYKYLLLGTTFLCTVAAIAIALLSTPIYRAEIQVAPADDGAAGNSLTSLVSGAPGIAGLNVFGNKGQGQVAEDIATLESPMFTIEFIEDNGLLPVLFADRWDSEKLEWAVEEPGQIPSLQDGYSFFNNEVRQIAEDDSGIVTLAIEWRDPQLSADWANALIRKLNLRMRQKAIDEADRTIAYLQKELEKTNVVEIRQAIYSMMENQLNTRTVASVREEYAFRVISPALVPDSDKYVSPRRAFIVVLGGIVGVALGVFFSFLAFGIKRIRAESL